MGRNRSPSSIPGVYTLTNTVSGTTYIGRSVEIRRRWNLHRSQLNRGCHDNRYLQHAWNKYGEEAFAFSVWADLSAVPEAELSDRLHQAEAAAYAAFPQNYNLMPIEEARVSHAAETLLRMAEIRTARWADPEFRERVVANIRAAAALPENRKRKSASLKLVKNLPEQIAKNIVRVTELWLDPE